MNPTTKLLFKALILEYALAFISVFIGIIATGADSLSAFLAILFCCYYLSYRYIYSSEKTFKEFLYGHRYLLDVRFINRISTYGYSYAPHLI